MTTNVNRMCNLGTFAEYIVVHEASVIRVEPWYDLRAAALLSCGISTGFGAAVNRGGVKPGDVVAVIGCGGLGSAAIQGALHAGARAVIAIDTNQSKIDRAMKIGATHGSTTTLEAAFTILPDLTWGKNCDVVIITVGEATSEIIEQARSITAKGGVIVAAGHRGVGSDLGRPEPLHVLDDESGAARDRSSAPRRRDYRSRDSFDCTTKASS